MTSSCAINVNAQPSPICNCNMTMMNADDLALTDENSNPLTDENDNPLFVASDN